MTVKIIEKEPHNIMETLIVIIEMEDLVIISN